jgi:hypothetical protein
VTCYVDGSLFNPTHILSNFLSEATGNIYNCHTSRPWCWSPTQLNHGLVYKLMNSKCTTCAYGNLRAVPFTHTGRGSRGLWGWDWALGRGGLREGRVQSHVQCFAK